jgi:hypothetical protein
VFFDDETNCFDDTHDSFFVYYFYVSRVLRSSRTQRSVDSLLLVHRSRMVAVNQKMDNWSY